MTHPTITCSWCREQVTQVASATLGLALWQHQNWTCAVKRVGRSIAEREAMAAFLSGETMNSRDVYTDMQVLHGVMADVRELIANTNDREQLFQIHDELKRAESALSYLTTAALAKVDALLGKDVR